MSVIGELIYKIKSDTKGFNKGIKDSQKSLKGFDTQIVGIVAGLGAAGLTKSLIDVASEAQETSSKFNQVFRSISEQANISAESLSDSYGLSSVSSKKLLSDTGDLLTGFGFTQAEALGLATEVNKLAVDLASFTNYSGGTEGASVALTKALLGESEQAKALGIVIRQDSDEYKNSIKAKQEDLGVSLLQAKALTALEIATKQSQNAIGDYARTSQDFANTQRRVQESLKDLQAEIGGELLPIVGELLDVFETLVSLFIDAPVGIKVFAGTLVAIVSVIAAVTLGINGLTIAFGALAANPIIALILIGGTLAAGFIGLAAAVKESKKETEAYLGSVKDAGIAMGVNAEEALNILEYFETAKQTAEDYVGVVKDITEEYGVTESQIAGILLKSGNLTKEEKNRLLKLDGYNKLQLNSLKNKDAEIEKTEEQKKLDEQAEIDRLAGIEKERKARKELFRADRKAILDRAETQKSTLDKSIELGVTTEEEKGAKLIAIEDELQGSLLTLKENYLELFGSYNEQFIKDSVKREGEIKTAETKKTEDELAEIKIKADEETQAKITESNKKEAKQRASDLKQTLTENIIQGVSFLITAGSEEFSQLGGQIDELVATEEDRIKTISDLEKSYNDTKTDLITEQQNAQAENLKEITRLEDSLGQKRLQIINNEEQARIKELNSKLSTQLEGISQEEKTALALAGYKEKTAVEKLQDQLSKEEDLEKKATIEKEISFQKIRDQFAKKREATEKAIELEIETAQKEAQTKRLTAEKNYGLTLDENIKASNDFAETQKAINELKQQSFNDDFSNNQTLLDLQTEKNRLETEGNQEKINALTEQQAAENRATEAVILLNDQFEGLTQAALSFAQGDYIGTAVQALTTLLQPALEVLGDGIKNGLSDEVLGLVDILLSLGTEIGNDLLPVTLMLIEALVPFIVLFTTILSLVVKFLPILEVLDPLLNLLLIAVTGLTIIFDELGNFVDYIVDKTKPVQDFFDSVTEFFDSLNDFSPNGIKENADNFGSTVKTGLENFGDFLGFAGGGVVDPVPGGLPIRVAENGSGEVMFNTGNSGQDFINQMGAAIAQNLPSSNGGATILNIDGEEFTAYMQDSIDNNRIMT